MSRDLCAQVDGLLRRDPGKRGLASYQTASGPLAAGHFARAVESLAESATHVAIVTGFCIPVENGWTAETDGPPGALFLARALLELGVQVRLLSDDYGRPLLEAGADFLRLPREIIDTIPFESPDPDEPARRDNGESPRTDAWVKGFLSSGFGNNVSHAVAIERCGPGHTPQSWLQMRSASPANAAQLTDLPSFDDLVPAAAFNHCHNMRGQPIDAHTAKAHRLFEILAEERPEVNTIGIADGGNEIGTGAIPFHDVLAALNRTEAARIICRIRTAQVVLAGVSNWGGYALALAACHARGRLSLAQCWSTNQLGELIEILVRDAGAVDGVTRRREPGVDGIPLSDYLQWYADLRALFDLD